VEKAENSVGLRQHGGKNVIDELIRIQNSEARSQKSEEEKNLKPLMNADKREF
jgi:hypothetical protein